MQDVEPGRPSFMGKISVPRDVIGLLEALRRGADESRIDFGFGPDVEPALLPFGIRIQARCEGQEDRKSTRLNSSHQIISYAVFCLKKKKKRASGRGCVKR